MGFGIERCLVYQKGFAYSVSDSATPHSCISKNHFSGSWAAREIFTLLCLPFSPDLFGIWVYRFWTLWILERRLDDRTANRTLPPVAARRNGSSAGEEKLGFPFFHCSKFNAEELADLGFGEARFFKKAYNALIFKRVIFCV